jgi:imidazolonepropionase-like amidohydrolase
VKALSDGNEATSPVTADVWAEHSVWPQDPGFSRALANGGVTTLQILPGSANLFGGRSVVLKNVYARTTQGMKFPGAPYGLKMACGENPKRVYGSKNREPSTRMGNIAVDRQTWIKAVEYKRKWDKYENKGGEIPGRDIAMDTLMGVLNGEILVHNHCYRADEMANVIDMSKEFGYHVSAFHHAVEAYKIADLLKANGICAAVWADWYGFKMESYDGIRENLALLQKAGACVTIHSDDQNGIQRLNQEVAKGLAAGRRAGIVIPDEVAWEWLAINPAKALGIADRTGSLKAGKMGDVVLWNGNPFSVYTRPEKVWIDGAILYDAYNPKLRPVSDFELGQPGEGDTK